MTFQNNIQNINDKKLFKLRKNVVVEIKKTFIKQIILKNAPSNFNAAMVLKTLREKYMKNINKPKNNKFKLTNKKQLLVKINEKLVKQLLRDNIKKKEITLALNLNNKIIDRMKKNINPKTYGPSNDLYSYKFKNEDNEKAIKLRKLNCFIINKFFDFMKKQENKFLELKAIKYQFEELINENNIDKNYDFSISTYYNLINKKHYLNFSNKNAERKKLYYNNDINSKILRRVYARNYLYYIKNNYLIISIDETGFSAYKNKIRGWELKGKKLINDNIIKQESNISLIAAITEESVLAFQLLEGGTRGADFFCFLTNVLKILKNKQISYYVMIMDNGKCHKNILYQKIKEFINIHFLPPYTAYLNPIEIWFNYLKRRLRKIYFENELDYLYNINLVIRETKKETLNYCFKSINKFLERSLNLNEINLG